MKQRGPRRYDYPWLLRHYPRTFHYRHDKEIATRDSPSLPRYKSFGKLPSSLLSIVFPLFAQNCPDQSFRRTGYCKARRGSEYLVTLTLARAGTRITKEAVIPHRASTAGRLALHVRPTAEVKNATTKCQVQVVHRDNPKALGILEVLK